MWGGQLTNVGLVIGTEDSTPLEFWVAVAALLLLTNARELSTWSDLGTGRWWVYGAIVAMVTLAALRPRLQPTRPDLAVT